MATKSVSIRFEEEMLKKISYIAEYEGRSVNRCSSNSPFRTGESDMLLTSRTAAI